MLSAGNDTEGIRQLPAGRSDVIRLGPDGRGHRDRSSLACRLRVG